MCLLFNICTGERRWLKRLNVCVNAHVAVPSCVEASNITSIKPPIREPLAYHFPPLPPLAPSCFIYIKCLSNWNWIHLQEVWTAVHMICMYGWVPKWVIAISLQTSPTHTHTCIHTHSHTFFLEIISIMCQCMTCKLIPIGAQAYHVCIKC